MDKPEAQPRLLDEQNQLGDSGNTRMENEPSNSENMGGQSEPDHSADVGAHGEFNYANLQGIEAFNAGTLEVFEDWMHDDAFNKYMVGDQSVEPNPDLETNGNVDNVKMDGENGNYGYVGQENAGLGNVGQENAGLGNVDHENGGNEGIGSQTWNYENVVGNGNAGLENRGDGNINLELGFEDLSGAAQQAWQEQEQGQYMVPPLPNPILSQPGAQIPEQEADFLESPRSERDETDSSSSGSGQGSSRRKAIPPDYQHPPHLPSWGPASDPGLFTYTEGRLVKGQFTSAQLAYYFDNCPRSLRLWVQTVPAQVNDRTDEEDRKCRWEGCPSGNRTLLPGWYRVAFDEMSAQTSSGVLNPYRVAGSMHLFCFEQCFDLAQAKKSGLLQADNRPLPRENHTNKMALNRDKRDAAMIEQTYEPWFRAHGWDPMDPTPYSFTQAPAWNPRPHQETLGRALTHRHTENQLPTRDKCRAERHEEALRKKADAVKKSIDQHEGNLKLWCDLSGTGRAQLRRVRSSTKSSARSSTRSSTKRSKRRSSAVPTAQPQRDVAPVGLTPHGPQYNPHSDPLRGQPHQLQQGGANAAMPPPYYGIPGQMAAGLLPIDPTLSQLALPRVPPSPSAALFGQWPQGSVYYGPTGAGFQQAQQPQHGAFQTHAAPPQAPMRSFTAEGYIPSSSPATAYGSSPLAAASTGHARRPPPPPARPENQQQAQHGSKRRRRDDASDQADDLGEVRNLGEIQQVLERGQDAQGEYTVLKLKYYTKSNSSKRRRA